MLKKIFALLLLSFATTASGIPLGSQHALIVEEATGRVLYEKNATRVVPIASITKLMTAMVALDAKTDLNTPIRIDADDVDDLKHTSSRVPIGTTLPLRSVLKLALMSSDNRAAAALARTYPGGNAAFKAAVRAKIRALGMTHTTIEEPTGLSSHNKSTAADIARMAYAAAKYPDIVRMTTDSQETMSINGRAVKYRNTNKLVGARGWDILLSKTGFTRAAGKCIVMRIKSSGRNVIVVLLNARASSVRTVDAIKVRRFVSGGTGKLT